jgi:hypothetical protein
VIDWRKQVKTLTAILIALLLALPTATFAAEPIKNLVDVPLPIKVDGSPRTLQEVRQAIVQGCQVRGWTPVDDGPQKIRASILVRAKHYAEVDIPYTTTSYSITYRSSKVLDYDEKKQKIHRNYNKWVFNLSSDIQKQFSVKTTDTGLPKNP